MSYLSMSKGVGEEIDQKTLRRNIFTLIWPATIESALQMMVGIVATAMVGRLGEVAIGATGLGARITGIVWCIFAGVGTGTTVFVARAIGAKDTDFAKRIAIQALIVGVFIVFVLTGVVYSLAFPILKWFGAEHELLDAGVGYLRLVVWGMPFMAIMQITGAILRGAGDTKTPMMVALMINIINVAANYVLIFGKLGLPALGIRGAAIAAIVAQSCGAVIALWVLYRPSSVVPVRQINHFSLNSGDLKRLLNVGVPVAAESLMWQFATILLMKLIVGFGTTALAAHQLGLTAESLSYMPSQGFNIAAVTLVGQSLGQGKAYLAERYVREIRKWSLVFTTFVASILFFMPKAILGLLTNETAVIELGAYYLMFMAVAQFPQQLYSVMGGALRGAGDTKSPMIFAAIALWLIRLPGAYLLGAIFGFGVIGVWAAMTVDLFVRFMLMLRKFATGQWKSIQLLT